MQQRRLRIQVGLVGLGVERAADAGRTAAERGKVERYECIVALVHVVLRYVIDGRSPVGQRLAQLLDRLQANVTS